MGTTAHLQVHDQGTPYARHRFSVADFHRMAETGILGAGARVELVRGEIIEMAPIGTRHAEVVDRLTRACLLRAGEQVRVRVQGPVCLDDATEVQPDVAILRAADYAHRHPGPADVLLLIEVADTTLTYDRDVKLPLYAAAGIPEVWLVDLTAGRVIAYREPTASGCAQAHEATDTLAASRVPELSVPVAELLPAP